jgi:polygalacturonase
MASLLALLHVSGAFQEVARASNDTSSDSTSYLRSSGASGPAAAPRSRSLAMAYQSAFSLDSYGARGDGRHDDTQALEKAWKAACASPRPAVVLVPNGRRYLLKLVTLRVPCKSSVTLTVKGTLVASPDRADWSDKDRRHWIVFRRVNKLTVNGGGTIDGNGQKWWPHSCKINKTLVSSVAPTADPFVYLNICKLVLY